MNKKKVIYVSWVRLTDKYARDWYIDYLIENGIEVEYWDVVSLTREHHNESGELDVKYLCVLHSYEELENLLRNPENKDAIYVLLISYSWRTRKVFRLMSKYKRKMALISWGAMPVKLESKWLRALDKVLKNPVNFLSLLLDMASWIADRKLKLVVPFDIVFAAGSVITTSVQFAKKIVPINLCDYDHYTRVKDDKERFTEEKYAVFLDINLPYQSDLTLCGLAALNPDDYYKSLNRFFGLLEQQYGVKILIATHPKSSIEIDAFKHRESYRLCTAELVKDAEFVITHTSTALSYVVLNLKPCVFIYTDEMEMLYKTTVVKEIRAHASYLDALVYNIDQIKNDDEIFVKSPNITRYYDYKYSFLTSKESENFISQEIFLRELNASQ